MNWRDFWYNSNNPKLANYLYGPRHVIFLLCAIGLVLFLYFSYRKKTEKEKRKMFKIFAYIFLGFEIVSRVVNLIIEEDYSFGNITKIILPMHICSIMVWIFIFGILLNNKTLKEFAGIGGLLSTLAFLLYPAVGLNRVYMTFTQLYSTITHILGFVVSILLITIDKDVKYKYRDIWKIVLCFVVMFGYGVLLDFAIFPGSDYMYLANDPLNLEIGIDYRIIYFIVLGIYINLFYIVSLIKNRNKNQIKRRKLKNV